jgi:hypothetical protein
MKEGDLDLDWKGGRELITRSETYWKLFVCLPSPYTVKGSFLSACTQIKRHTQPVDQSEFRSS